MTKKINIVLFAYNFPHQKTIDVIDRVYREGFNISLILAANHVFIRSPKSIFKFKKEILIPNSEKLAKKYHIPFYVVKHNSLESIFLLKKHKINLGIIAGARILKHDIIQIIQYGVLNFHPGILPYVRGLDSMLWSIYKDYPIGVTAHLINDKIDAGYLVYQKQILISLEDDIYSLYQKNYALQLDLISISLNLILENHDFQILTMGEYNQKMSYPIQLDLMSKITQYITKHST